MQQDKAFETAFARVFFLDKFNQYKTGAYTNHPLVY